MLTLVLTTVGIVCFGAVQAPNGGSQAAKSVKAVIEGRVTDAQGRPLREGKVMFAPQDPPIAFHEAWRSRSTPKASTASSFRHSKSSGVLSPQRSASLPRSRARV